MIQQQIPEHVRQRNMQISELLRVAQEGVGTKIEYPYEALVDAIREENGFEIESATPAKAIREAANLSIGELADKFALLNSCTVAKAAELIETAERGNSKDAVSFDLLKKIAQAAGFQLRLNIKQKK